MIDILSREGDIARGRFWSKIIW